MAKQKYYNANGNRHTNTLTPPHSNTCEIYHMVTGADFTVGGSEVRKRRFSVSSQFASNPEECPARMRNASVFLCTETLHYFY